MHFTLTFSHSAHAPSLSLSHSLFLALTTLALSQKHRDPKTHARTLSLSLSLEDTPSTDHACIQTFVSTPLVFHTTAGLCVEPFYKKETYFVLAGFFRFE